MAQVHFGGDLHQQHDRSGLNLFASLLPMWLHQCENSSHPLHPAVGTRPSSLSRSACGREGGRGILSHAFRRFHGSSGATHVIELARLKSLFAPAFSRQEYLACSSSYFSSLLNVYKRRRALAVGSRHIFSLDFSNPLVLCCPGFKSESSTHEYKQSPSTMEISHRRVEAVRTGGPCLASFLERVFIAYPAPATGSYSRRGSESKPFCF
jgi:hypothetical protein